MDSEEPRAITTRKFMVRDLKRNIEFEREEVLEFNGYIFTIEDGTAYYVTSPSGFDIGRVDLDKITEQWLQMHCTKSKPKEAKRMKQSHIKSKPRKKKKFDIILKEFMIHLHSEPCIVEGCTNTNIEAHHAYGRQPMRHDILCVPLCVEHHRGDTFSVHEGNVAKFRKIYTKSVMGREAIKIATRWINDGGSHILSDSEIKMLSELIPSLEHAFKDFDVLIKEFLLEYYMKEQEQDEY